MISTRRIVAAVGLAVGVTGLAAPLANAAGASPQHTGKLTALGVLDSLSRSDIPAQYKDEIPKVSEQVQGLNGVHRLSELHQITDLAAPVMGLVPGIEA
ncbi:MULTISPECIES: hypothetical protein [Streptomyces]|uniref:hypothetical protein n=1 Tax=Streptomyces TaxID=1883 RepID=UPI000F4D93CF|nr:MULTISPECIES: hypothetical protein [Streptomyces]RPE46344.1 hypothetical protein EDD90_9678 [Streptomyces sp. Ag109_O5-1]